MAYYNKTKIEKFDQHRFTHRIVFLSGNILFKAY